jgi:hypothetical protein
LHTKKEMHHTSITFTMAALAGTITAHMNMFNPPPMRYKNNPYTGGDVDWDITSPITLSQYPCKGTAGLLDGPEGTPVATWQPGAQYTVQIEGTASHNGGSCQVSLSYNKGASWTVIYSKIGNCPTTPYLTFTLPTDTPAGNRVLLGWTWINHTGNREVSEFTQVPDFLFLYIFLLLFQPLKG